MKEANRRGTALKVITDFSLNEVYPMLFEMIKKGANDQSPYVRMIALNGILKVSVIMNNSDSYVKRLNLRLKII